MTAVGSLPPPSLTPTCSEHHRAAGELAAIFTAVTTTLIEVPLTASTRQHRAAGEMLFVEGEMPAGVYVLHSGEVDLLFMNRHGSAKPLRVATPGQILGLSSVVMRHPHDCSAIARTPCEVGFTGGDEFLQSLHDKPATWLSVLRMLSSDVNAVYDDMRTTRPLASIARASAAR
jgi:cAMP-binding proteins - catabolite gene activator and regulatory subunit of cAMP-dependent protein kinases